MKDQKLTNQELEKKVAELKEKFESYDDDGTDNSELQDVVNSEDEVIGSLPRGVIWDNELQSQTRVVNVFIVDMEGKILLPVRSMKKRYLPGGYDFSCGENLKAGEPYEDAVMRGLQEELGMTDVHPREIGFFVPSQDKATFCFGKVYLLEVGDKSEVQKFNANEIDRQEWRTRDEIVEMLEGEPEKFKRDYKTIFTLAFE